MTFGFSPRLLLSSLTLGLVASCGGAKDNTAVGTAHSTAPAGANAKRVPPRTQRLFAASVSDRLIGPYIARGPKARNLVAWVESGEANTRRVRALVTDDSGIAIEPTRDLVSPAGDVTSLVVKRAGGDNAGTVLAWTVLGDRGESLRLAGAGDDASLTTPPVDIARSSDDIVWVEVVPTRRGAIVVWAEENKDGKANVLGVAVDGRGKARGVPSYIARGVVGWQAAAAESGAAVAILNAPTKPREGGGFALSLARVDDEGRAIGAPIPVVAEPSVQPDFEMVRIAAGTLFAWTDRSGLEPEVKSVLVDDRQRIGPVERTGAPVAGAKLVGLTALSRGALVAYEEPSRRQRDSRRVVLSRVGATGAGANAGTVIELAGKGPPEIAASGDGAVVLGRMRVCDRNEPEEACNGAPFVPASLELDAELSPVRAERIEHGSPAEDVQLAWGLSCAPRCLSLALGANEGEGQPQSHAVLAAPLFARPTSHRVALYPLYTKGRPRPRSVGTVMRTEPVAEVAVARTGGAAITAVLTRGDEGAGTKSTASLYLVPVDKEGKAGSAVPLSTRAAASGGVSMATGADASVAVAWSSREEGGARIKLARVSGAGKKLAEVFVTTRKGEVSSVNVVAVEGGYVVAWVDHRDGQGELYATKVTADLSRVSEHQRLTNAPGDASDVAMVAHPSGVVWIAWSDPRESPREGTGDVYAISVRAKDARKASEEVRVLASAAHSRSPSLAVAGDGVAIGFIEEAPIGAEAEGHAAYGAMLAWLDARGHAPREPVRLRGAGRGAPVGIVLDGARAGSRGILVRSAREELALDAFTVEDGGRVVSSWLLSPEGPPTLDVALTLDGPEAFFAEEGRGPTEHRVRRLSLEWP